MKPRSILAIGLLTVLMLVACAPAASPTTAQPEAPVQPALQVTEPPAPPSTLPTETTETQPQAAQTEVQSTEAPQVVATSRGPDLESTDPATVSLASGELQLVEFFRYT